MKKKVIVGLVALLLIAAIGVFVWLRMKKSTAATASAAGSTGSTGLSGATVSTAFNEQAYLAANPDVAAAVAEGRMESGYHHYMTFGQYEGRLLR